MEIDPTLGEQIDLERSLDLGRTHKMDRSHHHSIVMCEGEMQVTSYTGNAYSSACKTCGMTVTTTLSDCKVSR